MDDGAGKALPLDKVIECLFAYCSLGAKGKLSSTTASKGLLCSTLYQSSYLLHGLLTQCLKK